MCVGRAAIKPRSSRETRAKQRYRVDGGRHATCSNMARNLRSLAALSSPSLRASPESFR